MFEFPVLGKLASVTMKLIRFASCGLLLIGLAFCVGCVTSETDAAAYTPPPSIDDASETLQNQLFASVPFLAKQQIYLVPKTTQDAFYQIMLFLSAGMQSEALAALDRLHSLQPELCMEDAFGIFKKATACAAWDVAQQIVERYGDRNAWIGLGELRAHWQHLCWNDAQVDAWLAAKAPGTNNFWIETRVRFLAASTNGDQLVAELEKKAQQHPREMGATFLFFNALDALQDDCPSKTNRWDL
ncbi:MAG: hypothetical protein NTY53_01095 [Kiritimatiellaeota bacterium]|nr:hypothetical protein [Kiritimatiellota bacterium]